MSHYTTRTFHLYRERTCLRTDNPYRLPASQAVWVCSKYGYDIQIWRNRDNTWSWAVLFINDMRVVEYPSLFPGKSDYVRGHATDCGCGHANSKNIAHRRAIRAIRSHAQK